MYLETYSASAYLYQRVKLVWMIGNGNATHISFFLFFFIHSPCISDCLTKCKRNEIYPRATVVLYRSIDIHQEIPGKLFKKSIRIEEQSTILILHFCLLLFRWTSIFTSSSWMITDAIFVPCEWSIGEFGNKRRLHIKQERTPPKFI